MKWISAKDRLPEVEQDVLLTGTNVYSVGWLIPTKNDSNELLWDLASSGCGCCKEDVKFEEVTHWMPLPPEPTRDETSQLDE